MSRRSLFVLILWLIIIILSSGSFFFWDTVQLASKQANFFYENNFSQFFLPEEINSGHPPFYGLALAAFWSFLGRTLLVSHLFNAIFVVAFIYQSDRLGEHLLGKQKAFWVPLILFCNPIFLGHSILVSPDNALMFLFLLALNGLLTRKAWRIAIACLFLGILSMRGMMVVAALFLSEMIWTLTKREKYQLAKLVKYFPAGLAALGFLLAHYHHNQWLGFHRDSPWQESFASVSILGYCRNLGIIAWRFLDFGNIFLLLGSLYLLYKHKFRVRNLSFFIIFLACFSAIFILPLASFKYLSAHRYFMPIYALFSLLFVNVLVSSEKKKLGITVLALLFMGNWWIYPRSISQGWDVSLGHVPFYRLVEEMNEYVESENIDPARIGTEFPIKSDAQNLYLDSDKPNYKEAKVGETHYILYSKVINDYKDVDYDKLQKDYDLVKNLNFLFIDLKLYEKRTETQTRRAK